MLAKYAKNLKFIEALFGGILAIGAVALAFAPALPEPVSYGIGTTLAVVTAGKVWLAKNDELIIDAAEAIDDLVEDTVGAWQTRG
ncbi:hypothetical protein ACFU44_00315 [Nocardia rhizosphaerihabitans]|uniref:hypothetical protein n=1 Tax=Nocardia rhizosphaerihabitans TaxID=1691570 RepID=UPI00366AC1B0